MGLEVDMMASPLPLSDVVRDLRDSD